MIEHFLANYGYLVLFFGVALEGETFLLTAAYLASRRFFRARATPGPPAAMR
ncbi:MAG: hypothetical protein HY236_14870 [Acidobacteria bacterium]|nr:hypothetical protein [Acidobacteriota bacterium]